MTQLPAGEDHQVIHLGGSSAVVVPLDEYRRLRELERHAELLERLEAEEAAALAEYREQQRSGSAHVTSKEEVRAQFGLAE